MTPASSAQDPSPALSQWDCLLKNLGTWRGSFTRLSPAGHEVEDIPTVITFEGLEQNRLIRQTLDYGVSTTGRAASRKVLEYRTLNRATLFFDTGAFSQGSLQFSPVAEFGAELGLIAGDRRLRQVQQFRPVDGDSRLENVTLIRESLDGSTTPERPPLTVDQLVGRWQGQATTLYADLRPPTAYATTLTIERQGDRLLQRLTAPGVELESVGAIVGASVQFSQGAAPVQVLLLPDGGSCTTPLQIPKRQGFFLEAGWLISPTQRQRMIRRYDERGGWSDLTLVIEAKQA